MKITMTKEYYERTESGKSWKSKPYKVETFDYSHEQYENYTSKGAVQFMRNLGGTETVVKSYTTIGYVPVRITSISPDRIDKRVASFTFE